MIDYKEFCKLYPAKVPVAQHAKYYLETLEKSAEFAWIPEYLKEFTEFQEALGDERAKDFKMKMLEKLKEHIQASKAYERFQEFPLNAPIRGEQKLREATGAYLLSIDMRSANYSILRCFDPDELPGTWEFFAAQQGLPLALIQSKKFRQVVFGNCNPSRNQKLQRRYMTALAAYIEGLGLFEVVFFSNDEMILDLGPVDQNAEAVSTAVTALKQCVGGFRRSLGEGFQDVNLLTTKLFSMERIGKKKYVRTYYHPSLSPWYKTLSGVPGNQFFMYFKKYVLGEDLDDRDYLFVIDDMVAKWTQAPWEVGSK